MDSSSTTFLEQLVTRRNAGIAAIAKDGPRVDDTLVKELLTPGSDVRCGVNVIARPNIRVAGEILRLQDRLRTIVPLQYYYPLDDLHLTYLEVCHSRGFDEVEDLARRVVGACAEMAPDLPSTSLSPVLVGIDPGGCALNCVPLDDSLQRGRQRLSDGLVERGITSEARYLPQSAHITFMRYKAPVGGSPAAWLDVLRELGTDQNLTWTLDEVWVTWGPNWYGMKDRVRGAGPFRLVGGGDPQA